MPKQVVPITGFDQVGVVLDSPPVSLPPNALSNVRNVRFKDGAVRKMEGEVNLFPNLFDANGLSYDGSILKYIVWWPNPNIIDENRGYYLVIREEANFIRPEDTTPQNQGIRDVAYLISPGSSTLVYKGDFTRDENANWQHTFFQGGFALIINNGLDAPAFILDTDGNTDITAIPDFATLPGWQSYRTNQTRITDTFNEVTTSRTFNIGDPVDFSVFFLQAAVTNPQGVLTTYTWTSAGVDNLNSGVNYSEATGTATVTFTPDTLTDGSTVVISILSASPVGVRAGVVRSFGDFLVAGNLFEFTDNINQQTGVVTRTIIRNLSGIVRTSDVAAPGEVPNNWDPFAAGVSTADEFVLTATGVVQDMVELQGNFYIYSNNSISVMRQTGNTAVPLSVAPLTDSYGAQTTEAVREFDGKHFVIGSQDIYVFGGHPGSIQSLSDQRVRRFFFDNLNPLHNQRMFTFRYSQRDEIWICYPTTASIRGECDQALIWNYRQDIWTIRDLTSAVAGAVGPVPGGGLPTSTNSFTGANTGSLESIQAGIREQQTLQFPDRTIQIENDHAGVNSIYDINVQNLADFNSAASAFDLTFLFDDNPDPDTLGEPEIGFDSGPVYGSEDVNNTTPAVSVTIQLLESSTPAAVTLELPRFLRPDHRWRPENIYFAGSGQLGSADYYPGQRVIDDNAAGVPTVYRVTNGFGDGTTPSSFYNPNEDGPFYMNPESSSFVYQDTFDIIGVHPRDLVFGATYGTEPGDPGSTNSISASEARWEVVGPASTARWDIPEVITIFRNTLTANPIFNQFFRTVEEDASNNRIAIEALRSSGDAGFPTYSGLSIEFAHPNLNNNIANPPSNSNGGDIGASALTINAASSTIVASGAVTVDAFVRERVFVPFDSSNPTTTGRYATDVSAAVLDRVSITFNGTFSGATINEDVAAIVRDGFTRDPTAFWTTTGTDANINLVSAAPGNYELALTVTDTDNIVTVDNFPLTPALVGERATRSDITGAITNEGPTFRVTPPAGDLNERPAAYITTTLTGSVNDRGAILNNIMTNAVGTFMNWSVIGESAGRVTIETAADPSTDIPAALRLAERPANGTWLIEAVAPGNTINIGITMPITLTSASEESRAGRFALNTTPSYLGILVSNPTVTSGLEFLVVEAGDPTSVNAQAAIDKWIPQIQAAIPRIALQRRGTGFFLQPANYDSLANFVLDVRLNDTPANAEWIYRLAEFGRNVDTGQTGIQLNSASDTPLAVNGSELDHTFVVESIPPITDANYVRSGGPLKVAQRIITDVMGATSVAQSDLRIDPAVSGTTLIFDIFRPWPQNEINQNLEYPILATVNLRQDLGGIFRNLNKIVGADIGWSRPTYDFTSRTTTEDLVNFRETINGSVTDGIYSGDDYPQPYESFIERVQLAIQPEFDTEQLQSIALWADGETEEFLRGTPMHNQLDVRVQTTNYPGEISNLSVRPTTNEPGAIANLFYISQDYKIDMRMHGRFMNYRITDSESIPDTVTGFSRESEWRLAGMQADVMKGGTR